MSRRNRGTAATTKPLLTDEEVFGGWGANDEPVSGGWGAGDKLLSDEEVFGASVPLPAGVKPNDKAGAGRGGIGGPTAAQLASTQRARPEPTGNPMGDSFEMPESTAPTFNNNVLDQPAPAGVLAQQSPLKDWTPTYEEMAPWRRKGEVAAVRMESGAGPVATAWKQGDELAAQKARKAAEPKGVLGAAYAVGDTVVDAGRGAAKVVPHLAKNAWDALRLGADQVGATEFARFAALSSDAGSDFLKSLDNPNGDHLMTGAIESLGTSLFGAGVAGMGGALAAGSAQSGLDKYQEARNAGFDVGASTEAAITYIVAEYLGEKISVPSLGRMVFGNAIAQGIKPTEALKEALKQQGGEQLTQAMQSLYDKFGEAGGRPNMTWADYLDDVVDVAKQTAIMSGVAHGAGKVTRAMQVRAFEQGLNARRDALIAGAIDDNVANTYFKPEAISGYAGRAATDPNFFDPQFVDPQQTVRPPAEAAPAAPTVRVEDMPTTIVSPEQAAAMVQAGQQRRGAAQAQQQVADGKQVNGPAGDAMQPGDLDAHANQLLKDATDLVRATGSVDAAAVQRQFGVNPQTAAGLLDALQRLGVVGPAAQDGSHAALGRPEQPGQATGGQRRGVLSQQGAAAPAPIRAPGAEGKPAQPPTSATPPVAAAPAPTQQPTVPTRGQQTDEGRTDGRQRAAEREAVPKAAPAPTAAPALPQGSLAAAARTALERRQAAEAGQDAAPSPSGAEPQPARAGVEPGSAQRTGTQPATGAASTQNPADAPAAAAAPTRQAGEQAGQPALQPEPAIAAARFPTIGAATAAAVEAGQWQRMEPVQGADGWRLQLRQSASDSLSTAPPQAARSGDVVAPGASPALARQDAAPPQAAPVSQAGESSARSRPQRPASPEAATLQTLTEQPAVHADPGQRPEAATPAVVAESVAKAAGSTTRRPADLRAELVRQIEQAMPRALADDHPEVLEHQAAMRAKPDTSALKRQGASGDALERRTAAARATIDQRRAAAAERVGFVEFDVPGDGRFKVVNSQARLVEFRRLVERSAGFKAARPNGAPEPDGAQHGSPSAKAAIEAMVDDGDPQAAVDYAAARGVDLAELGLSPKRMAAVAGLTPSSDEPSSDETSADLQARVQQAPQGAANRPGVLAAQAAGAGADAVAVMPAELTQAQFLAQVDIRNAGSGANPWTAWWRDVQLEADAEAMDHPDLGRTTAMGGRFFRLRREAVAAAKAAHRRAVRRALQRGEHVPASVLAEYPDLAPQPAAGVETAPAAAARGVELGIDRELLAGREITVPVELQDATGPASLRIDAAKYLDYLDEREAAALAGNLTPDDQGLVDDMAASLAPGVTGAEAQRLALARHLRQVRAEQAEAVELVRQQHPDLFTGAEARPAGPTAPALPEQRIVDVGAKIGGARKDRWRDHSMTLADLDSMDEGEGAELVNKANALHLDYPGMVEAGSSPLAVAMVKLVADGLAARPAENTPVGRRRYVKAMQAVQAAFGDLAQYGQGLHSQESTARTVLQLAADRLRSELRVRDADTAVAQEGKRVLFSVYKGRSDPFTPSYSLEQRARRLVADGFPAKAEPWTRRFELSTAGGRGTTDAGVKHYQALAQELATELTPEQVRAGIVLVRAKGSRAVLAVAPDRAGAEAAARTLYDASKVAGGDGKATPERPHLDVLARDGLPERIDRPATPDDLLRTFGFRGVEFGNWAAQDERQRLVAMAFDGLHDLAEILGVPPQALSLNGSMGLAFGARGGGRFAAHYEPGRLVINMTKLQGGGSLAHEWAHALDHYLGELDQPDAYQTEARGASGWMSQRPYTGKPQRRMVNEGGRWTMREVHPLGNLRSELATAVDSVMRALYDKAAPQAEAVRAAELEVERLQAAQQDGTQDEAGARAEALKAAEQRLADARAAMPQGKAATDFARNARALSGKSGDYWIRPTEMFARAFEAYVFDRLVAMGARSDYLVHGVESDRFASSAFKGNPYPTGAEREAINAAFTRLFSALQTRQTDKGVALFQRVADAGTDRAAEPVADPQRVRLVRAAVSSITAGWANAPKIEVLASMRDAPAAVREANELQLAGGAQGVPSAFFFGGRVYLLAGQINNQAEAASAVAHEVLGHFGLRGLFGTALDEHLERVVAWREADVRAKATEYGLNYSDKAQRLQAAEEVLAELAQTQPELGLVRKAIAAVRAWLREHIRGLDWLSVSDDEIVARFILPARRFVVRGAGQVEVGADGRPAYNRRRESDDGVSYSAFMAWLAQHGNDAQRVAFTDSGTAIQPPAEVTPQAPAVTTAAAPFYSALVRQVDAAPMRSAPAAEWASWINALASRGVKPAEIEWSGVTDWLALQGGQVTRDQVSAYLADNALKVDQVLIGREQSDPIEVVYQPEDGGYWAVRAGDVEIETWNTRAEAEADAEKLRRDPVERDAFNGTLYGSQVLPGAVGYRELLLTVPDIRTGQGKAEASAGRVQRDGQAAGVQAFSGSHFAHDNVVAHVRYNERVDTAGRRVLMVEELQSDWAMALRKHQKALAKIQQRIDRFQGLAAEATANLASANGNKRATAQRNLAMYQDWIRQAERQKREASAAVAKELPAQAPFVGKTDAWVGLAVRRIIHHAALNGFERVAFISGKLAHQRYPWSTSEGQTRGGMSAFYGEPDGSVVDDKGRSTDRKPIVHLVLRDVLRKLGGQPPVVVTMPLTGTKTFDQIGFDITDAMREKVAGGVPMFQRRVDPATQPASDFALRPFGAAGRAVEVVQDRYNRWKQAIDDVRQQGGTITDDNDFYRAEERYWGQVGSRMEAFKDELGAFVKAVSADGLSIDDVARYAYAQHAEERNEFIARKNPDMPDGGSGMTNDEADDILNAAREAGVADDLQRHAATLRGWIQGTRDVLVAGGLIDQRTHQAWAGMFSHYVPLRGLEAAPTPPADAMASAPARNAAKRGGIRGEESEHATGRRTPARQIIEQIVQDRARALVRVGRNEVLRSFARFVLDNPSPTLWEINAVQARRTLGTDEHGNPVAEWTDEVVDDERTITLKDGGEEVHILVHDAKLLEQLKRMGIDEHPIWPVAALLHANRVLGRLYTSLNPVFTVTNFLRDVQAASFGVIDEIGLMGAAKLFAMLPGAMVESFKAEAGRKSADYQLYEALGGKTAFFNLKGLDQQAQELDDMVAAADRLAIDPRELLPKAMGLIEAVNGAVENATRLAAFKVALGAGNTHAQAASIAKNITVNFNRKGTQNLASAWVLFWNPAVQGTARIVQSLAHPKVQATVATAMLGVMALALRNAGMGDDDDGVAWWDKIPDEVKERNLVIVLPPGASKGQQVPGSKVGRYIKVPMPYGYNFFAVVANQAVDVWRHSQDPKRGRDVLKAGVRAFSGFAGSWLPAQDLGRALSPEGGDSAGKSAVLMAVPDALDPLAQVALNQSSFGRALRPDTKQGRTQPDSSVYFPGQHGNLFQKGAAELNALTGGSRYRSGLVDVAPSTLETLARAYGGAPLGFGLDVVNALYLRQTISRPELDAKRLPFARQFLGTIDAETDRLAGYQRLDDAEKVTEPLQRAQREGDAAEARRLMADAGPLVALGSAVGTTRHQLGEIIKAERHIIDSQAGDADKYSRLMALAERRRVVLQRFTQVYDRAVQAAAKQEGEH